MAIEHQSFNAFGDYIIASNPDIYALEWVVQVEGNNRANFEAQVREKYGLESFKILEPDGNARLKEAEIRPDYFPIVFLQV